MSPITSNCETFSCSLGQMCRIAAGAGCLLSGLVLTVTFWLMFVGIPGRYDGYASLSEISRARGAD